MKNDARLSIYVKQYTALRSPGPFMSYAHNIISEPGRKNGKKADSSVKTGEPAHAFKTKNAALELRPDGMADKACALLAEGRAS